MVLKVRLHYAQRLVQRQGAHGAQKKHEMRSRMIAAASSGRVVPGSWVWFATLKGKWQGVKGCAVLGGARFVREEGPLIPGSEEGERRWNELEHTVSGLLREFVVGMPSGYRRGVWAWEFADAIELETPVEMADSHEMTFVQFRAAPTS